MRPPDSVATVLQTVQALRNARELVTVMEHKLALCLQEIEDTPDGRIWAMTTSQANASVDEYMTALLILTQWSRRDIPSLETQQP